MDTRAVTDRPSATLWFARARGVAGAYYRLAVADLALARAAGIRAAAAGALALVAAMTAYLAFAAAAALALVHFGLAWPWALLIIGAVSTALAAACALRIRALLRIANFETSRRQFDRFFAEDDPHEIA